MPRPEVDPSPALFVFFGLIATGKSSLAQAWAADRQAAYYNSDRLRKELAGLAPAARQRENFDQGIYTAAFSQKTYTALLARAEFELARGRAVVLDGSYQQRRERDRLRCLAGRLGCRLYFILCTCPEDELRRRLAERARDPHAVSDGRWEIYQQQKQRFETPSEIGPGQLLTISTLAPLETLVAQIAQHINNSII